MLKDLLGLCSEKDTVIQKLVFLSLLEVFKDIIPGCACQHTHTDNHHFFSLGLM